MNNIISFIWFNSSNEPIHIDKPVVCVTEKNKLLTFNNTESHIYGDPNPYSNWKWICEKYRIKYWAYQENLIP